MPNMKTATLAEIYEYYRPIRGEIMAQYICDIIARCDAQTEKYQSQCREVRHA